MGKGCSAVLLFFIYLLTHTHTHLVCAEKLDEESPIEELEKKMNEAAQNGDFETAGKLQTEVKKLKEDASDAAAAAAAAQEALDEASLPPLSKTGFKRLEDRLAAIENKLKSGFEDRLAALENKLKFGFELNDEVKWTEDDEEVPKGTVGTVVGFTEKDDNPRVKVKFPNGTWFFKPSTLMKASEKSSLSSQLAALAEIIKEVKKVDVEVLKRRIKEVELESTFMQSAVGNALSLPIKSDMARFKRSQR